MLPPPIRARGQTASTLPVLQANNYAVQQIGFSPGSGTEFASPPDLVTTEPNYIEVRNSADSEFINVANRWSRIAEVCRDTTRFPATVADALDRYQEFLASGRPVDAGLARIVNDVSALADDPDSMPLVAARGAPVVLMHRAGRAEEKYAVPAYGNVVEDVRRFLLQRAEACQAAGIARERIALDPGLGFGKSVQENVDLIAGAGRLAEAGYPVLIGASRKSFIGKLTGTDVDRRLGGSIATALLGAQAGASGLRVHDVAATRDALRLLGAVAESGPAGYAPLGDGP